MPVEVCALMKNCIRWLEGTYFWLGGQPGGTLVVSGMVSSSLQLHFLVNISIFLKLVLW